MHEEPITIETTVNAPIAKVWEYWNDPMHIEMWAYAADDWEATDAQNDLRVGGKFKTHMGAKDKSQGFDFGGTYTVVKNLERIEYTMEDGRKVKVEFMQMPEGVHIRQTFDLEHENSMEDQRKGWQTILDNFKKHVEESML